MRALVIKLGIELISAYHYNTLHKSCALNFVSNSLPSTGHVVHVQACVPPTVVDS